MTGPILASFLALWVVVIVQAVAIFALYHHFGEVYLNSREGRANQGPALGSRLKPLQVQDLVGTSLALPASGKVMLLLFMSTTCVPCSRLQPELVQFVQSGTAIDMEILVICAGDRDDVRQWAPDLIAVIRVVPDPDYRIATHYEVGLTPFSIGIDSDGVVRAKGIVNDAKGLESVIRDTLSGEQAQALGPVEILKEELA